MTHSGHPPAAAAVIPPAAAPPTEIAPHGSATAHATARLTPLHLVGTGGRLKAAFPSTARSEQHMSSI